MGWKSGAGRVHYEGMGYMKMPLKKLFEAGMFGEEAFLENQEMDTRASINGLRASLRISYNGPVGKEKECKQPAGLKIVKREKRGFGRN